MNKKGSANLAVILIIVAVVIVGGYLVLSKKSSAPNSDQNSTSTSGGIPDNVNGVQDETAYWQSYRNDIYKFEIKSPEELVGPANPNMGIGDGGTFHFDFKERTGQSIIFLTMYPKVFGRPPVNLESYLTSGGFNWIKGDLRNVHVDNLPAKEYLNLTPSGKSSIHVFFVKDDNVFEFGTTGLSEGEETVDLVRQILSTLKFFE